MRHVEPRPSRESAAVQARLGADARALARRLERGEVAIVDCVDLDATSATALAAKKPAAVINASTSVTGRVNAGGAATLLAAGVMLVDVNDRAILACLDGDDVSIEVKPEVPTIAVGAQQSSDADELSIDAVGALSPYALGGEQATVQGDDGPHIPAPTRVTVTVAQRTFDGVLVDSQVISSKRRESSVVEPVRAAHLTASALDLILRDGPSLADGRSLPDIGEVLKGKHVLVVGAAPSALAELKAMRHVIADLSPVIVAVGDASGLVAQRHKVSVIVGPIEAAPDSVLSAAKVVVIHGESRAVAATRLGGLSIAAVESESRLDSAELAIVMAAHGGARTILTAGMPWSWSEVDGSPAGASAVLARVAAGKALIAGETLASVYRSRWSRVQSWLLVAAAVAATLAAIAWHPLVREAIEAWLG